MTTLPLYHFENIAVHSRLQDVFPESSETHLYFALVIYQVTRNGLTTCPHYVCSSFVELWEVSE